ncbi:kelch protein, putative [Plasmodium gallinaceum]|uniref:Kelch protein, putative n=1 Tax=Plasmodium gallinaceum TaxID=5849 RepID=A0A1J1GTQ3_PLAGA|nr:kelch protein, putative [Plasmodium gallinaceum]CRG94427.1 kelch protein, putative [Plasmodium gallinaceum]
MDVLNKDFSSACLNRDDYLNNENDVINIDKKKIINHDIFNNISSSNKANNVSNNKNHVNKTQIINRDNKTNNINDTHNKIHYNEINNFCNTKEELKKTNNEVEIVYSYVINDSKNINSNNELITIDISFDEDKKYIFRKTIKKLPFFRYGHFLCLTKNGCVLAIGGTDGKKKYGIVEKYCQEKKKWKQINIMHFSRSNFCGVCTDNNDLFILGGEGDQSILKSVEYFDSKINAWRSLPPLNCVRHSASAIIFQNFLFIIGGKDGIGDYGKVHKSVEMLNLNEKNMKWVMCNPLKQARLGLATIVFKNKIYAIGGSTGVKNLSSVEIYDLNTNSWIEGPNLNFARSNLVAFTWKNHLVVYGGINKQKGDLINSAEILNEKTSCWILLNENDKA